jgi:hypothetical protein
MDSKGNPDTSIERKSGHFYLLATRKSSNSRSRNSWALKRKRFAWPDQSGDIFTPSSPAGDGNGDWDGVLLLSVTPQN